MEEKVRNEKVEKIIKKYTYYTTAAGLVPIPVADLVLISGLQLKMISEISAEFEVKFSKNVAKNIIGSLLGFILPNTLTKAFLSSAAKTVPGLGTFLGIATMPVMTGAATWSLGQIFQQHFEKGGSLEDLYADKYEKEMKEKYEEGKKVAEEVKEEVKAEKKEKK